MNVASMFSGCGGLDFAFHKQSHVVYANDFDIDSCNTYYKFKPTCDDIKNIPNCDILMGGFPCLGFSISNLYRNESDTRNKLYLELVRILKLKYFIFENVRGICSLGGYDNNLDKKNQYLK